MAGSCIRALITSAVTVLAGCRSPTQISVEVTTDACKDLRGTAVSVGPLSQLEGKPLSSRSDRCTDGRVGSLVVVPSGGKDEEIGIRVVAGVTRDAAACAGSSDTSGCIVARRALRFLPHEDVHLRVSLTLDCLDVPCGATETCVNGKCRDARIADPGKCTKPPGCGDEELPPLPTSGKPFVRAFDGLYSGRVAEATDGTLVLSASGNPGTSFGGPAVDGSGFVLARLDHDGNHLWTQVFHANDDLGHALSIALDAKGEIAVTGEISGGLDIGAKHLPGAGSHDVFVARLDRKGNEVWSRMLGDTDDQYGRGVVIDPAGSIAIVGSFINAIDFAPGKLVTAGDENVFVAKLAFNTGATVWAKQFGDKGRDVGRAIARCSDGTLVVVGSFEGVVDFGGVSLISAGKTDGFAIALDKDGKVTWGYRFGGASFDTAFAVAVDATCAATIAGSIEGNDDQFEDRGATANRAAIIRLDPSGNEVWTRRFGDGKERSVASAIGLDPSGNAVVAGHFVANLPAEDKPSPPFGGGFDVWVAKIDPLGKTLSLRSAGDKDSQWATSLAMEPDGRAIIFGYFGGALDFAEGKLAPAPGQRLFLARISP